ncbi:MAG: hypothetical protein HYV63_18800 [Candidatus Schekmanbacteria bacterium]|nr:hypothetical protein [Candidatus Schekmanbacteria bacterium]
MKRSGMAWGLAGGQAILTLRSWLQSGRFAAAWHILSPLFRHHFHTATKEEIRAQRRAA